MAGLGRMLWWGSSSQQGPGIVSLLLGSSESQAEVYAMTESTLQKWLVSATMQEKVSSTRWPISRIHKIGRRRLIFPLYFYINLPFLKLLYECPLQSMIRQEIEEDEKKEGGIVESVYLLDMQKGR